MGVAMPAWLLHALTLCPNCVCYTCLLQHLPLNVDLGAFKTGKDQDCQVRLPDYYPVGGLSKADVHGDMGIIVIALNWPK